MTGDRRQETGVGLDYLAIDGQAALAELISQAGLVSGFEQAGTEGFVDLDGGVNDGGGDGFDIGHKGFEPRR